MEEPMNFGQALALLLGGRSISRAGWNRNGMLLALETPTGNLNQPFIAQHYANGECSVYTPTQQDILATDWNATGVEGTRAAEHAGVGATG
jgi:hypothetical protein